MAVIYTYRDIDEVTFQLRLMGEKDTHTRMVERQLGFGSRLVPVRSRTLNDALFQMTSGPYLILVMNGLDLFLLGKYGESELLTNLQFNRICKREIPFIESEKIVGFSQQFMGRWTVRFEDM